MVPLSRALASLLILPFFLMGASFLAPVAAPDDPPRIVAVEMSAREIRAGQTILGHVTTSTNVASVEARVRGYSAVFSKRGVGEFALNYTLPSMIPWFVHGTYMVRVIARNTAGVQAVRELPVRLR
jgi:hypothetical protein